MGKLKFISLLRVFAIMVVVFFHCYQMLYSGHIAEVKELYYGYYYRIAQCGLINIAMPLFFAISGYLFIYIYNRGGYNDFLLFVKNKSLRLLLPYVVFSIIMIITTGYTFGLSMLTGFCHLWFLPRLFECFLLTWVLRKYLKNKAIQVLILLLSFLAIDVILPLPAVLLGVNYILRWWCWLLLGCFIFDWQSIIFKLLSRFHLWVICFLPYLLLYVFDPTPYGERTIPLTISVIFAILGMMYLASKICEKQMIGEKSWQYIDTMSKLSYGLFIFHFWFGPYFLSTAVQRILPLKDWAADHIFLFPLLFTLVTIASSFIVTYMLQRNKIGKYLV